MHPGSSRRAEPRQLRRQGRRGQLGRAKGQRARPHRAGTASARSSPAFSAERRARLVCCLAQGHLGRGRGPRPAVCRQRRGVVGVQPRHRDRAAPSHERLDARPERAAHRRLVQEFAQGARRRRQYARVGVLRCVSDGGAGVVCSTTSQRRHDDICYSCPRGTVVQIQFGAGAPPAAAAAAAAGAPAPKKKAESRRASRGGGGSRTRSSADPLLPLARAASSRKRPATAAAVAAAAAATAAARETQEQQQQQQQQQQLAEKEAGIAYLTKQLRAQQGAMITSDAAKDQPKYRRSSVSFEHGAAAAAAVSLSDDGSLSDGGALSSGRGRHRAGVCSTAAWWNS